MTDVAEVGAITTQKITYRRYVKTAVDKDGKTVITDSAIQAASQKSDKDTGIPENWARLERDGYSLFSENDAVFYTVKTEEGEQHLIPDSTQRLYFFQTGLDNRQGAIVQSKMKELDTSSTEPAPMYNQETFDLKEDINEPVSKQRLDPVEKIKRQITALGLSPEEIQQVLLAVAASTAAAAASEEVQEVAS